MPPLSMKRKAILVSSSTAPVVASGDAVGISAPKQFAATIQNIKHVGMRITVVEKLANASRLGGLQSSFGDIRMLTDAPSRKAMLSEKSETDRISTANMNSRQKKRKLAAASG